MSDRYHHFWSAAVAAAVAIGTVGCLATDVGNPEDGARDGGPTADEVDVDVRFEGLRHRPDSARLTLEDGLHFEEIWLVFDRFGLRREGACGRQGAPSEVGPVAVDLLGEDSSVVTLPDRVAGSYCGFDADTTTLSDEQAGRETPEALAGRSVLIRGRVDGGPSFEIRDPVEVRLGLTRSQGTFEVDSEARNYLLTFVLEKWLDPDEIRELEGDPVVIDPDQHADLLLDFRKAFRRSAYLFRDSDADGELQDDERATLLAASRGGDSDGDEDDDPDAGIEDAAEEPEDAGE